MMLKKWMTSLVGMTALKYVIAAVAQYLAVKFGVDQGTTQGILLQVLTVLMASWGTASAAQEKVVIDGTKVKVSDMTPADKATVKAIAKKTDM